MVPTRLSQVATRACCGCALRFHIITRFYRFKTFIAFNHLVWRYYPKQKEYKIEDLILESNMEVYTYNQPLWHFCQVVTMGVFGIQVARANQRFELHQAPILQIEAGRFVQGSHGAPTRDGPGRGRIFPP